MGGVTLETVNDKIIIVCNYTSLRKEQDFKRVMNEARVHINKHEVGTILILSDLSRCRYDKDIKQAMADFATENAGVVLRSAVIGASVVGKVMVKAAQSVAKRQNIRIFDKRDEAVTWLVTETARDEATSKTE